MRLSLEFVMSKSTTRTAVLHPIVKLATELLIENSHRRGVNIVIVQGLRTIDEQNKLYAQGRTTAGSIVTNAKGGYSNHNFGVAIDFALLLDDGKSVSWDTLRDGDKDSLPDWSEVVDEAKKIGFEWGGDWRSFKDMPHFEMTFGLSTAQYRAGKQPSQTEINKIVTKIKANTYIKEETNEMTEAEKKEFASLKDTVEKQTKIITQLNETIKSIQEAHKMDVPTWAKSSIDAAIQAKLIDTPDGGSYDFYRILTLMKRAKLI